MDACFELLLSDKQPLNNLQYYQKTIVWGGIEYPQKPKYYIWGKYIRLVENPVPKHILEYLSTSFAEQTWICLSVEGEILNLLELEVNAPDICGEMELETNPSEINWEGKTIDSLFELILTPQEKWVVIFEWQCDQIDQIYYLGINECISKLKHNLKYEKPREGFLIVNKNLDNISPN